MSTIGDIFSLTINAVSLLCVAYTYRVVSQSKGNPKYLRAFIGILVFAAFFQIFSAIGICLVYFSKVPSSAISRFLRLIPLFHHFLLLLISLCNCLMLHLIAAIHSFIGKQGIRYFTITWVFLCLCLSAYPNCADLDVIFTDHQGKELLCSNYEIHYASAIGWGALVLVYDNAQNLYLASKFYRMSKTKKSESKRHLGNAVGLILAGFLLDLVTLAIFLIGETPAFIVYKFALNATIAGIGGKCACSTILHTKSVGLRVSLMPHIYLLCRLILFGEKKVLAPGGQPIAMPPPAESRNHNPRELEAKNDLPCHVADYSSALPATVLLENKKI